VAFCATAPGDAVLHWQFWPSDPVTRNSDIVDANTMSVANRTLYTDFYIHVDAPSPTSTPSGEVAGHLVWQGIGQPDIHNAGITGTLTLCAGGAAHDYSVGTDASGFFTITTGLPPGSYGWYFKARKWLAAGGTLTISSGGITSQELGIQRAGDANNTNLVDVQDFSILKNTFGKALGDPGYDERADFNNDSVVASSDFALLKGNFGQAGESASCP